MTASAANRGVADAKSGAIGVSVTRGAESGYKGATGGSDEYMPGTQGCSPMETVVKEGQTARKARKASTDGQGLPLRFGGGGVLRAMWTTSR